MDLPKKFRPEDFENLQTRHSKQAGAYAVDSEDNIYFNTESSDVMKLPRGSCLLEVWIPQGPYQDGARVGEARCPSIIYGDIQWDSQLGKYGVSVEELGKALDIPEETVEEGMWLTDPGAQTIRLACQDKVITVAGKQNCTSKRDGYARLRPNIDETSEELAHFLQPVLSIRVRGRPLIAVAEFSWRVPEATFRLIDLSTWKVSTLASTKPAFTDWITFHPLIDLNAPHVSNSVHMALSHGVKNLHINVDTGEMTSLDGPLDVAVYASPYYPIHTKPRRSKNSHSLVSGDGTLNCRIPYPLAAYLHSTNEIIATQDNQICVLKVSAPKPAPVLRTPPNFLPMTDLSCLINCDSIPLDIEITHEPSSYIWKLSGAILEALHPSLDLNHLSAVILNSQLPFSSLDLFVHFLHQKSLPRDLSVEIWLHLIGLHWANNLPVEWIIHRFSVDTLPTLPSKELCLAYAEVYQDGTLGDEAKVPLLTAMWYHIQMRDAQKLFHSLAPTVGPNDPISAQTKMFRDSDVAPRPHGLPSQTLNWTVAQNPQSLLVSPLDFVFVISASQPDNDIHTCLVGNMLYLYPRWTWFKRLMDLKECQEAKTRMAELPAWVSVRILDSVFQCLFNEFSPILDHEEAHVIMSEGGELGLFDHELNAYRPFHDLVAHAKLYSTAQRRLEKQ